jgi:hypothetical protein
MKHFVTSKLRIYLLCESFEITFEIYWVMDRLNKTENRSRALIYIINMPLCTGASIQNTVGYAFMCFPEVSDK